jgi:hypothetical protein
MPTIPRTRNNMRALLLSMLLLAVPVAAKGQEVPEIVTRGFAAYESGGYSAALDAWLAGWGADDIKSVKGEFIPVFIQMEEQSGAYVGSEVLGTVRWGEHARRVYALVMYEERPLFARFDLYQVGGQWRVLNVTLNTNVEQVFPAGLLAPPGFAARSRG